MDLIGNIVIDGLIGGVTGQAIFAKVINVGSYSYQQILKLGITKVSKYGYGMSLQVMAKGVGVNFVCGLGLDLYYGIKQYVEPKMMPTMPRVA